MKYLIIIFFALFTACASKEVPTQIFPSNLVTSYGADPKGKEDSSPAFKLALAKGYSRVIVPKGVYRIDESIEIRNSLFLESGVVIIRKKESKNDQPIFWLSKSFASLKGADKSATIKTQIPLAEGVIKVGHKNQDWKNRNILYCEVSSLFIVGPEPTDENENTAIFLFSSQEKKDKNVRASFFHTLSNLVIQGFDTGILLKGPANANSISNIILNRVGTGTSDYAVVLEGAMENRIYDLFHHFSPNSTTFLLDDYNGYQPVFNNISSAISEQGGKYACCLEARSGAYNKINLSCNTLVGPKLMQKFKAKKNKVIPH